MKDDAFSAVLVGDDDKLFEDDAQGSSMLRPYFLYTWIQTIQRQYQQIRNYLVQPSQRGNMAALALRLERRIKQSLSKDFVPFLFQENMNLVTTFLQCAEAGSMESSSEAIEAVDAILEHIKRHWTKRDMVWIDVLGSAQVVFCTLASAGASIVKRALYQVDDLIVDEAAAATEAELYIPCTFRPFRLLAVGDPKQLPATILSPLAEERGVGRSLHERLMYECNFPYVMLDLQYRMRPELSQFPSMRFYDGKLLNGGNVIRYVDMSSVFLDQSLLCLRSF